MIVQFMPTRLWIEVEDLFEYARNSARPSGIQRLAFEIETALKALDKAGGQINFVRHAPLTQSFRVVPWSDVAALFDTLAEGDVPAAKLGTAILPHAAGRQRVRKLIQRLPTTIRPFVIEVVLTSVSAVRAWGHLAAAVPRSILQAFRDRRSAAALHAASGAQPHIDFATAISPGDIILVLGSPWFHPDYAGLIRTYREQHGLRFAMLVYDLIPLRRPEWCDSGLVRLFRQWFITVLPLCDYVFTISKATATDVEAFLEEQQVVLPRPVCAIPIGTGLKIVPQADGRTTHLVSERPSARRALPPPGSYALIVSTIEARKNHILLFRVWRRLLEEMPKDEIPTLVFAGRVGWLVDDLMHQIINTAHLNGKLMVVESPTDAELTKLYTGCLFTLFPSFNEGWGLPVTESLAFGKPCLISDRTSLPEAGGSLARYFDPDNLHDAYRAIRSVIDDREGLARWEEQVRREFRPVPWSATAQAILTVLNVEL
jgi:glycosyltransferase involved in cell wall biosynthesis